MVVHLLRAFLHKLDQCVVSPDMQAKRIFRYSRPSPQTRLDAFIDQGINLNFLHDSNPMKTLGRRSLNFMHQDDVFPECSCRSLSVSVSSTATAQDTEYAPTILWNAGAVVGRTQTTSKWSTNAFQVCLPRQEAVWSFCIVNRRS